MGTKMKGLIKGLRYISQIFDSKEQEMQIGFPTDVKHVAHIGWDGPSVSSPSWMNEFRAAPLSATLGGDPAQVNGTVAQWPPQDPNLNGSGVHEPTAAREAGETRPPRRHASTGGAAADSSARQQRRHQSSGHVSTGSPGSEPSEGSRHGRRSKAPSHSAAGPDSPPGDLPAIPKQTRRKKTKGSTSGGGSSRSSRTKAAQASFSDPGGAAGAGVDDRTAEPLPALPAITATREEEVF